MNTQSNVLVRDNRSLLDAQEILLEYCNDYMFYLDFYHDCYSISESSMLKFRLPECKFHSVEDMFSAFVCEEDLSYVLQGIYQLKTGLVKRKTLECRCYGTHDEVVWIRCYCEIVKSNLEQWDIIVGSISQVGEEQLEPSIKGLKSDTQFIADFCSAVNSDEHRTGYVMKLGVDNIKVINEKHGLHMAEHILQCTLQCILHNVGDNVRIYRTETEKFILFDMDGSSIKKAEKIYHNIKEEIIEYNEQIDYSVFYTISAGAAEFDSKDKSYIELRKRLDFAFNTATRKGKNEVFLYEQTKYEQYIRRLDIEEKLRKDVKNNFHGFEVFYQPIVDVVSEKVSGAEALLRWKCEEYGSVSPTEFVPILEESGLIIPVGRWVMKCAVRQCKEWQKEIKGFRMNINVSYIQLKKSDVAFDVIHNLKENQLDSKYVLCELTESGFVETDSTIRHIIKTFSKQKIKLGLDDFGTGYSNLCYLNDLKVYIIKIDRTFVVKAMKSSYHYKLLRHIVDMAHSINLKVCIEGVENQEELVRIKELHPEYIQGYYFGRPMDSETFYRESILNECLD